VKRFRAKGGVLFASGEVIERAVTSSCISVRELILRMAMRHNRKAAERNEE